MSRTEEIFGNVISFLLVLLIVASIVVNIFNLVFREGVGSNMYGTRGEFYME